MTHPNPRPASCSFLAHFPLLVLLPFLLATGIDSARAGCDPRSGFFAGFSGKYRVDLKTDRQEFKDFLEVRDLTRHPGMANAREEFGGTYTVPNRFEVPVEDGVLILSATDPAHDVTMTFRIEAAENGQVYPVYFRFSGLLRDHCVMSGVASFDFEGEDVLGDAVLVKLPDGCHCGERP